MPFKEGAIFHRLQRCANVYEPSQLGLTRQQFATLLQFCDTGPYFATTKQLHKMLQTTSDTDPYPAPNPPISLSKLYNVLSACKG